MNGVSSFGPNIENILGDILVKRSTIKELLAEIKNISVSNIEKSNSLVEKMMSITQVITERTKEIEKEYSIFLTHKNNFSDLTYWEEVVYPDITNTFEDELKTYLKQLMNLESICEKYFIQVLEDKLAEDDKQHLITDNPYNKDKNINSNNYFYPDSIGYNWYSIKASDDYMTNSKAVLNVSKYDKDEYIPTNQINKPSILHETISFHPKYGLVHYLSLGRERTLSPIRDEEDNSPVSTIEFKTFDGFTGEMNELKSHIDRNIHGVTNNINKNDLKYNLLMRHNMNSNDGSSYFILKMRDYEPIENTPDYYFINRNNLDTASITRSFTDKVTTKSLLNISTKNNNDDISYADNDTIVKAKEDNDVSYTPNKRLSDISSNSYYDESSYLNINGKEYNLIRKAYLSTTNNWIYNKIDYKPFINYAHISKCNNTIIDNKDLLSNLKLKIIPYSLIDRIDSENITFNGKYERFHTLAFTDSYSRYQYSHKEFLKSIYITPLGINTSLSTDGDTFPYNKTILDRRIINNNNINFDRLSAYTLQEYYTLNTENTKKNLNDYYYENYNKGVTLTSPSNQNTLIPEINRKLQSNTIISYDNLKDYNQYDTTTQEHSVYIYSKDSSEDNNKFKFKTLKDGNWPTNTMITYWCCTGKHIWALGRNFNEIYYSEDAGLTWNKSTYDKQNSTKPYDNLSGVTCNTNCSSCYMLDNGLGIICECVWNNIAGCYLYTEDYGKTFRTMWVQGSGITSIEFVFINRYGYGLAGYHVSGQPQKISYTRDYGKNWIYTTTTTDINCVYVEDNDNDDLVGYAMGTNGYSGMQRVKNLKKGTPVWENYIPFANGNAVRTLAMIDWENNNGILPIINDRKNPTLFNLKTKTSKNLVSDGVHSGTTVDSCTGFWMDKFGNIFHTQGTDIYVNSNTWSDKKGTIKLEFGNEIDTADLGNFLYRPICVLFNEQIIIVQSKTNRRKLYRIPYGIRNYGMKRVNKYYNAYKQLDISNDNVSEISNEEKELIKERVKKELEKYYKEKDSLYIGTICALPYSIENEKWMKCDGRKLSKDKYVELYNKLGDIYNTGDEEEGFFSLPNMRNKTVLGGNKELVGKSIEDSLPDIEFEAVFSNNETVFENDKRFGIMSLESTVDEEAIGLMGGFETGGMNKSKLKIPHNSTAHETVGNMYEVEFYVRVK